MLSRINDLLAKIDDLKSQLQSEYDDLRERYEFSIDNRRVVFSEKARRLQISMRQGLLEYVLSARVRNILSIPFIYSMIVPAAFLDLFLTVYQHTAFRLYGIERVRRDSCIIFDRKYLGYLNTIQKINCLYCSYVNGLFMYASEIGGRTERYWCPIKYARKIEQPHRHYREFADFGDAKGFKELYNSMSEKTEEAKS